MIRLELVEPWKQHLHVACSDFVGSTRQTGQRLQEARNDLPFIRILVIRERNDIVMRSHDPVDVWASLTHLVTEMEKDTTTHNDLQIGHRDIDLNP